MKNFLNALAELVLWLLVGMLGISAVIAIAILMHHWFKYE